MQSKSSKLYSGHSKWDPSVKVQPPKDSQELAERVCAMPPELFWSILDGISIGRVLQVSASLADPTNFDEYVVQQAAYGSVFPSSQHLANLRNASTVLFELRTVLDFVVIPPG